MERKEKHGNDEQEYFCQSYELYNIYNLGPFQYSYIVNMYQISTPVLKFMDHVSRV